MSTPDDAARLDAAKLANARGRAELACTEPYDEMARRYFEDTIALLCDVRGPVAVVSAVAAYSRGEITVPAELRIPSPGTITDVRR